MAIDELIADRSIQVILLPASPARTRAIIQSKLNSLEKERGASPGSLIEVTDSAYRAICALTQSSIGLALEVMNRVMPTEIQLAGSRPYVITETHIAELGLTYEGLCQYWDSIWKDIEVFEECPRLRL